MQPTNLVRLHFQLTTSTLIVYLLRNLHLDHLHFHLERLLTISFMFMRHETLPWIFFHHYLGP